MSFEDIGSPGSANVTIDADGQTRLAAMNKGIVPLFFIEPVQNDEKTEREGRPIFDELERVRILVAGDQYNQITHPVDAGIKRRFPDEYRRWKETKEERHVAGTPIRAWPILTPAQVAEFEALNILNVEGLANMPDTNIGRMQGLREWRAKAKAWLDQAVGGAEAMKMATDNMSMKEDLAELRAQLADLTAQLALANKPKSHHKQG